MKICMKDSQLGREEPANSADDDAKKLREELARVAGENEQLKLQLAKILSSRSWQLTSFPRRIFEKCRRILPVWCFRSIPLDPIPTADVLESTPGKFTPVGAEPILELRLGRGKRVPAEWVRFRADLNANESQRNFLLYYKVGGGFQPSQRSWLVLSSSSAATSANDILLHVPRGVTEFRLDPFELDKPFELKNVSVAPLGSVQLWCYLARTMALPLMSSPGLFYLKARKALSVLRRDGAVGLLARLHVDNRLHDYPDWVRRYDTYDAAALRTIKQAGERLHYRPTVSLVMPTYNPPVWALRAAIDSVLAQTYPNWELCIADDASTDPEIARVLNGYAARDRRIKVKVRSRNGHISEASNDALLLASGEFVGLLDNDDTLAAHALFCVVATLNNNQELDYIYSDEDKIDEVGNRFNPYFKPDWSPELFLAQNYTTHFSVYRRSLITKVGGFRTACNGAQDWDLTLRVVELSSPERIHHIPRILYHWRVLATSTAASTDAKPYVLEAQALTVREHLERSGIAAKVEIRRDVSQLRVTYSIQEPAPVVSIIIPTKDQGKLLDNCVRSIYERTTYAPFEVIVVNNRSTQSETDLIFRGLVNDYPTFRVVDYDAPFNFSAINNFAVKEAKGSIIGFLNNDLEVIAPDWLAEMVALTQQSEIGAVGARLLYPTDALQHGGVVLGIGGVAGHSQKGRPRHDVGYFNRLILTHNVSAVTAACVVLRTEVFNQIGGFNEVDLAVAFNDVDLCLRIREAGYRIVMAPKAELYHFESASRGYEDTPEKVARFEKEKGYMRQRWGNLLDNDPYYNPNLTILTEDFAFAFPPRLCPVAEISTASSGLVVGFA